MYPLLAREGSRRRQYTEKYRRIDSQLAHSIIAPCSMEDALRDTVHALCPGASLTPSIQDHPAVPSADAAGGAGGLGGVLFADHRLGPGATQQPARPGGARD